MNRLGRVVLNSPARAAAQRRYVIPTLERIGGTLDGLHILEIGCGRGVGTELLLDRLGAGSVHAIDIDPTMVRLAADRLAATTASGRARVRHGDMTETGVAPDSYDAVVDLGALHLEPNWRGALAEVSRVLRPGGRFYFEEIVRPSRQVLVPLATGHRIAGAISHRALLDELARLDFAIVDTARPRLLLATGVVGDLLGVARLR